MWPLHPSASRGGGGTLLTAVAQALSISREPKLLACVLGHRVRGAWRPCGGLFRYVGCVVLGAHPLPSPPSCASAGIMSKLVRDASSPFSTTFRHVRASPARGGADVCFSAGGTASGAAAGALLHRGHANPRPGGACAGPFWGRPPGWVFFFLFLPGSTRCLRGAGRPPPSPFSRSEWRTTLSPGWRLGWRAAGHHPDTAVDESAAG